MPATLTAEEAVRLIEAARVPADLFGSPGSAGARGRYRLLARLTHPDSSADVAARSTTAFTRLASLWAQHQRGYGRVLARGDIANFYLEAADGALLKLPRDPADNDLMDREAVALAQLHRDGDERFGAYFPRLLRTLRVHDPQSGAERRANVVGRLAGFHNLAHVRSAFPRGVDPRDAAWMWRRLLVAIGAAHRAGLVHGAVLPEHVLIHPGEHGLVLVDWCYSCRRAGDALPAIVGRYRDWYPPDVLAGEPAGPDTDIWLATRCISELMGPRAPAGLAAFAAGCALTSRARRPHDAWQLLTELDELLERRYGPRTFRPFTVPA